MKVLYAIIVLLAMIGIYIFAYTKNRKTPVPEGCEELSENCAGCSVMLCPLRKEEKI
ncbi:MAG: hypothetical protein IKE33_04310 [Erysipelotrichaceae bacterium]|nr:hypothetical protein [Erysipelotrichaceae bacterium]